MKPFLFFAFVLLALFASSQAPSTYHPLRQYGVADSLPGSFVTSIVQDEAGFLWVGTLNGLARFDGIRFTGFSRQVQAPGRGVGNRVSALVRSGKELLLLTENGLEAFDPLTFSVRRLDGDPRFTTLRGETFHAAGMTADPSGWVWVKGRGPGLYRIHPAQGRMQYIGRGDTALATLLALVPLPDGAALAVGRTLVHRIDREGRIERSFPLPPGAIADHDLDYTLPSALLPSGEVLLGKAKLFALDPKTGRIRPYAAPPEARGDILHAASPPGSGEPVLSLGRSLYWVTTGGLQLLATLPEKGVTRGFCLWANERGAVWMGTPGGGLFFLPSGLDFLQAASLQRDLLADAGALFGAPLPAGINAYTLRSAPDGEGGVWTAGQKVDGIPLLFRTTGGRVETFPLTGLSGGGVKGLARTPSGGLLALTSEGVLLRLQRGGGGFGAEVLRNGLPKDGENGYLLAASDTEGWVANGGGLTRYDLRTGTLRTYTTADGLPTNELLYLLHDERRPGWLWIATAGAGLVHYEPATGRVEQWTTREGLPNNQVHCLAADRQGRIWMSTNNGLAVLDPGMGRVQRFGAGYGLLHPEFNRYHFLPLPDGRLLFGGSESGVTVTPARFAFDTVAPPLRITGLQINGGQVAGTPLFTDLVLGSGLRLDHDQNTIRVDVAALHFGPPGAVRYRYRLEGWSSEWVDGGPSGTAQYTALPPGRYRLVIETTDGSGRWSGQPLIIPLRITPPWWATTGAYLGYLLLALGAGWWLLRRHLQRQRLKGEVVLQQQRAEGLRELDELKNRFFANITHEFRTPLTLILAPLDEALRSAPGTPPLQDHLLLARRSALRLQVLVNQMMELARLESGTLAVHRQRGDLALFLSDTVGKFAPLAREKGLCFRFTPPPAYAVQMDRDKLEKIIDNLVGNAIKYTQTGGVEVTAHCRESGKESVELELVVRDTGRGIPPEEQEAVFRRFYQAKGSAEGGAGIGLALVRELVALLGGTIGLESRVGGGSTFTLGMPFQRAGAEEGVEKGEQPALPVEELPVPSTTDPEAPLVLVVEDDAELRRFLHRSLAPHYRVLLAANGEEGLEKTREEGPELVLTDWMMPGLTGPELVAAIKSHPDLDHTACILLTAKTAAPSRLEGLGAGADDYIAKPFSLEELLLRVGNLLATRRRMQERWKRQMLRETPSEPAEGDPAPLPPFLQALYRSIDAHIDEPEWGLDELAAELATTRRTLQRKVAALTGLQPVVLLRKYRLAHAARLLRSGESASGAAYASGFSSPAYFSTCFKEEYGVAPGEWRISNLPAGRQVSNTEQGITNIEGREEGSRTED